MSALSVKYESFFINMVLSGCEISAILREAAIVGKPAFAKKEDVQFK